MLKLFTNQKTEVMAKKLLLICAVAISTMCLSFTAFAPSVQTGVSGHVYDQSNPTVGVSEILVEEIVNNVVTQSVYTSDDGSFSISASTSSSTMTLRFSDPDYQSYRTHTQTFDLRKEDCSNVSVYMTSSEE